MVGAVCKILRQVQQATLTMVIENIKNGMSRQTQFREHQNEIKNLLHIINKFNGHFFVSYVPNEDNDNIYPLHYKNEDEQVVMFLWIPPWFSSISKYITFTEIDATFTCCSPYTAFIWMGVFCNNSFPLAFLLAPTESSEAYDFAHQKLNEVFPGNPISQKPFLTDRGSAIKKFIEKNQLIHFYCHFHILRDIGDEKAREIVRRMIGTFKKEVFEENIGFFAEYTKYCNEHDANLIHTLLKSEEIPKWALWERKKFGVATCTNHIESFHKGLNHKTRRIRNLNKCVYETMVSIVKRYNDFKKDPYHHPKKYINGLKKILKKSQGFNEKSCCEECKNSTEFLSYLYNFKGIPCIHTYKNRNYHNDFATPVVFEENLGESIIQVNKYEGEKWEFSKPRSHLHSELEAKVRFSSNRWVGFAYYLTKSTNFIEFRNFFKRTIESLSLSLKIPHSDAQIIFMIHLLTFKGQYKCETYSDCIKNSLKIIKEASTSDSENISRKIIPPQFQKHSLMEQDYQAEYSKEYGFRATIENIILCENFSIQEGECAHCNTRISIRYSRSCTNGHDLCNNCLIDAINKAFNSDTVAPLTNCIRCPLNDGCDGYFFIRPDEVIDLLTNDPRVVHQVDTNSGLIKSNSNQVKKCLNRRRKQQTMKLS